MYLIMRYAVYLRIPICTGYNVVALGYTALTLALYDRVT